MCMGSMCACRSLLRSLYMVQVTAAVHCKTLVLCWARAAQPSDNKRSSKPSWVDQVLRGDLPWARQHSTHQRLQAGAKTLPKVQNKVQTSGGRQQQVCKQGMVCTVCCVGQIASLRISISGKEFKDLRNRMLKGFIFGSMAAVVHTEMKQWRWQRACKQQQAAEGNCWMAVARHAASSFAFLSQ